MATLHPPPVEGAGEDHAEWPTDPAAPPPQPFDAQFAPKNAYQQYMPGAQFPEQNAPPNNQAGSKIFVGGLSWETDEDSLRRYFEQIGTVLDCVIMRDRHTGHPRGFGFVTFADDVAAENAASRRHDLDGRQVEAKHAVPRHEASNAQQPAFPRQRYDNNNSNNTNPPGPGPGVGVGPGVGAGAGPAPPSAAPAAHSHRHHTTKCKVFVGGLPSGCGVDEFRSYFSQFGDVVDAQVMIDHNTGNSRGFGFVTFGNEAIVTTVVGPGKSNTDHEIMGKCVEVKRAEPKGASSDRRNNRDSYSAPNNDNSGGGGGGGGAAAGGPPPPGAPPTTSPNNPMRGAPNNDMSNTSNGGTNAAASAAAAYYSNYPQNLAEQYGAFYSSPQQWQQYYAAMGYNFNAYQQAGYNPYQQYLQAYKYMSNAANSANGPASASPNSPPSSAPMPPNPSQPANNNNSGPAGPAGSGGFENQPAARYGPDMTQNGHGSRRSSQRNERYHPYR